MTALETAQLYFKLSNQADLNAIRNMFHPDAVYQSEQTGLFHGVDEIMTMMNTYFTQHQSLSWDINALKCLSEHEVEIDFTANKLDQSGTSSTVKGLERMVIVNDQIRQIDIHYQSN